ncbi:MAG: hypothetical protein K0M67_06415 [Thiobacillus sp.]|nr:hypothetical protein [Thiobacillus sp.]
MTRASDEQLELDFEDKRKPREQALAPPSAQVSASIVCFTSHLRLRRAREVEVEDAKLLERITSRVQHFK